MTIEAAARDRTGEALVPAGLGGDRASDADIGLADAAALVSRLGGALADMARTVDELGAGLAPALAAAAERDPALLVQAQLIDSVSQSLLGLSAFLADVGKRRIGCEPLHLDALAAALPLQALSDRMSGVAARVVEHDPILF